MRVLVGCEFSGIVRDAFLALGHDAWSCDLLPTERPGPHLLCDVRHVLYDGWDMAIFHPPCTALCCSGNRWYAGTQARIDAMNFVAELWYQVPIPRIAIENPVGVISTVIRKPDQCIHPWQFGHGEVKKTCLWLRHLPRLVPTAIVEGRKPVSWLMPDTKDQWKNRSRTYTGIAEAMAEQWGGLT